MFETKRTGIVIAAAFVASLGLARAEPCRGADSVDYGKLRGRVGPALVTVKCVLKVQAGGGSREMEREFTAAMIDKEGLVLCSSMSMGLSKWMQRMGSVTPSDIKVLIGDDTEGVEAKLLASDGELDLSWLQIKEPADKGYDCLDFSKSRSASLGEKVVAVKRMDKYYDRAVVISEGRIGGQTTKPRELLIPGGLDLEAGMPVFGEDGEIVGVAVQQMPDDDEMDMRRRFFGGGSSFILPAGELTKATQRARAASESDEEEEEEEEGLTIEPKANEKKAGKAEKEEEQEEEE